MTTPIPSLIRTMILLLVVLPLAISAQKAPIGQMIYTLGPETYTVNLRSLSVRFDTKETGEPGKEKRNTSVGMTVYDYDNNKGIRFTILDDKVVRELKGHYPLRFPVGFEEGEALRSTSIMVVDTKNSTNISQSLKGGTCEVLISGTRVEITIRNARVKGQNKELPFEFSLKTDQAKVKQPGE